MTPTSRPMLGPLLLTLVSAVACSGAVPPEPVAAAAAPVSRSETWLCASSPQTVSLEALGVPADARPIDLALSAEKVTILLSPARLVTFSRATAQVVDMVVGRAEDSWSAIDRDPTDGSLWLASAETVSLLRFADSGERSVIAGPRVEGRGGFRQIRIATDGVYATPSGATTAVWRLSRDGKLLGQSFPRKKAEQELAVVPMDTARDFLLARDLGGNVVGFDLGAGQLHRAGSDGTWALLPERFPASPSGVRSLRGEAVGTSAESWYFTDAIRGLFFLPSGPVFLGPGLATLGDRGSALFRIKDGRIETAIETCAGNPLLIAASDPLGYAAVSDSSALILSSGERRVFPPRVILGRFPSGN